MSLPPASLTTLHAPSFIIPDKIRNGSYNLISTRWNPTLFGMTVKVINNTNQRMLSFTIPLNRDNGEWMPTTDPEPESPPHSPSLQKRNIKPSEKWMTARQWLESNQLEKFKECINNESDKTTKHRQLTQLLKWAINEGKIQFIDSILNESEYPFNLVTVDGKDMGLIIFAITNGQSGILRILLNSEKVKTLSTCNSYYEIKGNIWSRLCLTIKQYRLDMTKMLIDHGDHPNDPNKATIFIGSPHHLKPCLDISEKFSQVATQEPEPEFPMELIELPSTSGESICRNDPPRLSIWELCLRLYNIKALDLLIKNGLNVRAFNAAGAQPMHVAARYNNIEAMKLLLENNANIDARSQVPGTIFKGYPTPSNPPSGTPFLLSPLHFAAIYHSSAAYGWLKEKGDEHLWDSHGRTAYYYLQKE